MNILDRIVAAKREEVARLQPWRAQLCREAEAVQPGPSFGRALRRRGEVALVAEVKRRSPSAGVIRAGLRPEQVARAYESAGAAAVSVLTDEAFFGGSLDDMRRVRSAVSLPILRKDFVLDPVQVWEARAAGADAVLLIVRLLDDVLLAELIALVGELRMDALVEVHDADELDRALAAAARVIGVNSRDLATFETDIDRAVALVGAVPAERVAVAESGIRTATDVDRVGAVGADAVLVGETLMRARDVCGAVAELVGRPRADAVRGRAGSSFARWRSVAS